MLRQEIFKTIIAIQIVIVLLLMMCYLGTRLNKLEAETKSARLESATKEMEFVIANNTKIASETKVKAEQKRLEYYERLNTDLDYWKELRK